METRPYPEGVDCVWLASDGAEHVGAFITAGIGPIPAEVLRCDFLSVDDIEGRLFELPRVSQSQLLVSVPRPDDFIELAERGLFVYDWTDVNRTTREELRAYEPVAVPTKPTTASSLPSDLAALVKALTLAETTFAAGKLVDVRAHLTCIEAE